MLITLQDLTGISCKHTRAKISAEVVFWLHSFESCRSLYDARDHSGFILLRVAVA